MDSAHLTKKPGLNCDAYVNILLVDNIQVTVNARKLFSYKNYLSRTLL